MCRLFRAPREPHVYLKFLQCQLPCRGIARVYSGHPERDHQRDHRTWFLFLKAIHPEACWQYWGEQAGALDPESYISYATEPFLTTLFDHGPATAYPPDRSKQLLPQNLWFSWKDESNDLWFQNALRTSSNTIRDAAVKQGQDVSTAALYPNYALFSTPSSNIYGAHLPRLQAIKKVYDPENVMSLTGGFKI